MYIYVRRCTHEVLYMWIVNFMCTDERYKNQTKTMSSKANNKETLTDKQRICKGINMEKVYID